MLEPFNEGQQAAKYYMEDVDQIAAATEKYESADIAISPNAAISNHTNEYWVQAWVRMRHEDV